jgi:hypothetical protein
VKFPSVGAERIHAVEEGVTGLKDRMAKLERYASLIPHKRKNQRNGSSRPSDTAKLHLVVGDVKFDVATGASGK